MKKIFVLTDNFYLYTAFQKIIANKNVEVDYYCSVQSKQTFYHEFEQGVMRPINVKLDYPLLLKKDYAIGFSCHSKQIFPPELVSQLMCINIHPGLNPYNRGFFPHVFSLINGLPAGVTIHIMDEKIDHGNVIIQEEIKIGMSDTSLDIYHKILKKEIELLDLHLEDILQKKFSTMPLLSEGNYNSLQDYLNLCEIDLDQKMTMREAINYLRAMTHPPYKNCFFWDGDHKIFVTLNFEREKRA